ncbi:MAG TPA: penicillin-binding protein 2 [Clostridia bacterium]|nr:penicillin-binding protein 2 [Clostridia bacterium]
MQNNFKRIRLLLIIVMIVFIAVSLYLVYFQLFQAKDLNNHSANSRNYLDETSITRGKIYDERGELLAYSLEEETKRRISEYPYSFAHIIGYSSTDHGKSGLESSYNAQLIGLNEDDPLGLVKDFLGKKGRGNDLYLTINSELQSYIYSMLEGHRGAIVVMDPASGALHSLVSSPSFNTNEIDSTWQNLLEREDGVFLGRGTQGLYTPGSIIKVFTATALLESDISLDYYDEGVEIIGSSEIYNFRGAVEGQISLEEALIYSTNTYFANKALRLGPEKLKEVADRFYFNKAISFELANEVSYIDYEEGMEDIDLAATSYGQGKALVTPLHMAMMISAVSQEGKMMEPYLVKEVRSPSGTSLTQTRQNQISQVTEPALARQLEEMLIKVVEVNGYNYLEGARIGGKTGTAENPSGNDHAWYVSFAKGTNKDLALAIVLEEEGATGGVAAAPIAQRIYERARQLGLID